MNYLGKAKNVLGQKNITDLQQSKTVQLTAAKRPNILQSGQEIIVIMVYAHVTVRVHLIMIIAF